MYSSKFFLSLLFIFCLHSLHLKASDEESLKYIEKMNQEGIREKERKEERKRTIALLGQSFKQKKFYEEFMQNWKLHCERKHPQYLQYLEKCKQKIAINFLKITNYQLEIKNLDDVDDAEFLDVPDFVKLNRKRNNLIKKIQKIQDEERRMVASQFL